MLLFLMFALIPEAAIWITLLLFIIGIIAGFVTDRFRIQERLITKFPERDLPLHEEEYCDCLPNKDTFKRFGNHLFTG